MINLHKNSAWGGPKQFSSYCPPIRIAPFSYLNNKTAHKQLKDEIKGAGAVTLWGNSTGEGEGNEKNAQV